MTKPFDIETKAKGIASRLMLSGEKVTGAKLAVEFGLSDSQQVRECVNWARKQGDSGISRIASDSGGYWWCSKWEDVETTVHHLRGRAYSILEASRGLAKSFGKSHLEQEALPL
jgi:hypothetical protein